MEGFEADLKTQQFETAMQVADLPTAFPDRARAWAWTCCESSRLRAALAGSFAVVISLVLQPPFVLAFDYDARRPWRATVRISWYAVAMAAILLAAAAAWIPTLL